MLEPVKLDPELTLSFLNGEELGELETLWNALYRHQSEHGMRLEVQASSFGLWASGYRKSMGSFGIVAGARSEGRLVGFVAGRVRAIPPHFGGGLCGFISDVFTDEKFRGRGISSKLLVKVQEWFRSKGLQRLELQVTTGNPEAAAFYRKLGWQPELTQMVYELSPA